MKPESPLRHQRLLQPWPLDLRSLAAFRVVIAAIVLVDLVLRSMPGSFEAFHTDPGVLPRHLVSAVFPHHSLLSLQMLSGSFPVVAALFAANGLCALALLLGWKTRWMTWACWLFALGLHGRNPMVLNSGDVYLRQLLLIGGFLPLGACASIDSLRRGSDQRPKSPGAVESVAGMWLLVQLVLVYFTSVGHKWADPSWRYGVAVHYALSSEIFSTRLGHWLVQFPALSRAANWGTLVLEGCGSLFALFPPRDHPRLRLAAILMIWGLHLGIMATMTIPLFSIIGMAGWVALLPSCVWPGRDTGPGVPRPHWLAEAVSCAGLLSCLYFSIFSLPQVQSRIAIPRVRPAIVLGLEQSWSMFSVPMTSDGWFVATGYTASGKRLNLLQPGVPADEQRPRDVLASMGGDRWRKLLTNLLPEDAGWLREALAAYFCRQHQLVQVEISFMDEVLSEGPDRERARRVVLISRKCGGEGGIRTPGEVTPTPVFKTGAFDHSATSPQSGKQDFSALGSAVNHPES